MIKIVLTGGGTAGHVTPNLALIPLLRERGYEIHYIGTAGGIEQTLILATGVEYHCISAGKLRRYLSLKNLTDPFKVLKGCAQAKKLLKTIKPDIIFSKGGYVAVPVVLAAKALKIPTVIHESDITPGLATKLSAGKAARICVTFEKAGISFDKARLRVTGSPIRPELFNGDGEKVKRAFGLDRKPIVLFMGGSMGARVINEALRECLPQLLARYNILHICGKGNLAAVNMPGYVQREYINEELADWFDAADIVVSRAGSNSINEFLALKKPMLLIPLSRNASRGDQMDNAEDFSNKGYCRILEQESMTPQTLTDAVDNTFSNRAALAAAMNQAAQAHGTDNVMAVIDEVLTQYDKK